MKVAGGKVRPTGEPHPPVSAISPNAPEGRLNRSFMRPAGYLRARRWREPANQRPERPHWTMDYGPQYVLHMSRDRLQIQPSITS